MLRGLEVTIHEDLRHRLSFVRLTSAECYQLITARERAAYDRGVEVGEDREQRRMSIFARLMRLLQWR
ncbi:hypothetical protein ABEG18_06320 [Alsobacter sp. KACC 23698]|uniref:Uncharacterized protein n=1 Tax=Alsobacter sp. KACC 23698 TaxID=3149229 RepID=A0AAU7JJD8_9HYPH